MKNKCKKPTAIIACGALAKEIKHITAQIPHAFSLICLPAILHNRPEQIPPLLSQKIQKLIASNQYQNILVAYADCGTGGKIAQVCQQHNVPYIHSPHCYAFFSTHDTFDTLSSQEIASFYLTDYLVSHFNRLIIQGLGIDRHPHLRHTIFKNYVRLVYLAQNPTPALIQSAKDAAQQLELNFVLHVTGYGDLAHFIQQGYNSS